MKIKEKIHGVLAMLLLLNMTATVQAEKVVPLGDIKGNPEVQISAEENDVTVLAHDANEIRVQASKENKELDEEKIHVNQSGNRINISIAPDYRRAIDLFVPVASKLRLSLTDGDLHVDGTEGAIEANVVDGDVILSGVRGPCVVEAVDGDIMVAINQAKPRQPISLSTVDGDVAIRLHESTEASIAASTVDGKISSELEIESSKSLSLSSKGKGPTLLSGSLNGGGASIRLQSVDGDIRILRGERPKKVKKQRFF